MRWSFAPLILLLGCGGAPAAVERPKDPTPLAKCSVQKSAQRPLVTEWPASEKARLESMLDERVVVVAYSGCEMRVLQSCRVDGSYRFKRTTIARDTLEIASEDDLYAKLPLGAVGLEGALSRSGRLAVRTTVVGEMRLVGEVPELPESGCQGATHVITGIGIGSFELVSGGSTSASAGVDAHAAGGGVKHTSSEKVVNSAGDGERCADTTDSEPSHECRSPIQVFLEPARPGSGPAEPATPDPEPRKVVVGPAVGGGKTGDKPDSGTGSGYRTAAIAVGYAATGASVITGVLALLAKQAVEEGCDLDKGTCSSQEAVDAGSRAVLMSHLTTGLFALGLTGIATGYVVLPLFSPGADKSGRPAAGAQILFSF